MSMAFGSPFGSSDPFSEMLDRFFGTSPASSPPAVQRVPIGRLLTESSHELLGLATQKATENGTSDLDTEHLLWAATQVDPARQLLTRVASMSTRSRPGSPRCCPGRRANRPRSPDSHRRPSAPSPPPTRARRRRECPTSAPSTSSVRSWRTPTPVRPVSCVPRTWTRRSCGAGRTGRPGRRALPPRAGSPRRPWTSSAGI